MIYNFLKVILSLYLLTSSGCEKATYTANVNAGVAREFYSITNDTEDYLINVKDIEILELVVEAEVDNDKGSMTLTLIDPRGNIYWQNSIQGDDEVYTDVVIEYPIDGNWKVTVKIMNAIGEYGLSWEGS